ncbi:unnamed protein product, partial [marine sediment metagenome]
MVCFLILLFAPYQPPTPKSRKSRKKTRTTLADKGHPGDPVVAEYEKTIKALKERDSHLQAENEAFHTELESLQAELNTAKNS